MGNQVRSAPLATARLALVVLDEDVVAALCEGAAPVTGFRWPGWWPDEVDRRHVELWGERAALFAGQEAWRPRAIVGADGAMVGHVSFHGPPAPVEVALADPTYTGSREPAPGGVVEVGYTIFPEHRRQGLAAEALAAMVAWALADGGAGAVLASVAEDNHASLAVLRRVGGFVPIGRSHDEDDVVEVVFRRRE